MLTITPARRSIIDGSTALLQRNTLFSTTDTSRSHVGSSISSTSSPSAIAALLTSTSTGPRREVTSPTIVATSAPTLTSARTATASPAVCATSPAHSAARSPCQSTTAPLAPSAANLFAIPLPIPEPAPVMTTTLSATRVAISRLARHGEDGVHLDLEAGEIGLDGGSRRHRVAKELGIDPVHRGEVRHVTQIDADANRIGKRRAGRGGHGLEVV